MSKRCPTCERPLKGDEHCTCFECNLAAIINAVPPEDDEPEPHRCDACAAITENRDPEGPTLCDQCLRDDEPGYEEPEEEDLVTDDHRTFYRFGFGHKGPVVVVGEDEDWRPAVRAYMGREHYFPTVWFISDHGNYHVLNINEGR